MLGSRAWRALVRRNILYRQRNWIGTVRFVSVHTVFFSSHPHQGLFLCYLGLDSDVDDSADAHVTSNTWSFLTFSQSLPLLAATVVAVLLFHH
jgi:hypothetical protein